jgi:hypothetical protein
MPVNTDKDEVTPFYVLTEGVLYFSSNGRATLGGLDIFKSKGFNRQWFVPENLGMPFNSGADDWYFIKKQSRTGGFFVSNRSVGMEKISSRDDDIFSFYLKEKNIELVAQGKVYEKDGQNLIENARISLFEQRERNEPRLLSSVMSPDGNFNFVLLPQKKYAIEVEKDGFRIASMNIMTVDTMKVVNRDFYLEKYAVLASNKIEKHIERVNEKPPIVVATKKTEPNSPKAEKNTPPTEGPKKTEPKKESSVTYKIQLMAYEEMTSIQSRRLSRVEDMGDIETETAVVGGKNYTRVMLAKFETYTEAEKALRTVKNRSLNDAFIIRYENGKRTNKSR